MNGERLSGTKKEKNLGKRQLGETIEDKKTRRREDKKTRRQEYMEVRRQEDEKAGRREGKK